MDPDDETLDPAAPPPATPPVPPASPGAPPALAVPPAAPPTPPPTPSSSGLPENERKALIADHSARAERRLLKKLFGTDDPAEVERLRTEQTQRLEQHQQMVEAEAERKRQQMSETERLQTDIARLTEENTKLKAELQKLKADQIAAQQAIRINDIAVNYVQPKWLKYATNEFRDYALALPLLEQKKLDERRIGKWFADFAKREPTCAIEAPKPPTAEPPAAPPAPPPATPPNAPPPLLQRRPLPAGARPPNAPPKPNAPPASADPFAGKTPLPGKPNSMTKQELRDYAKANNLPYPG